MVQELNNPNIYHPGAMLCAPGLEPGAGCEAVERGGVITWQVCDPSKARPHLRSSPVFPQVSTRHPEVCTRCGQECVGYHLAGRVGDSWKLELICWMCSCKRSVVLTEDEYTRFDQIHELQLAEIEVDGNNLALLTMREWVDLFVAAIHAGAILPEDF